MSIRSPEVDVPPNSSLTGTYNQADEVSSVNVEHVDPHTLLVIEKLFPTPTSGLEFLALLLRLAIIKQLAHGLGESHNVAVVTVQSIRVLAKLIGWSYETTHKYVVLFCALGLLSKHRENGKVQLRFPLCHYEPPLSLDDLNKLIEKARRKVSVCAKRVKHRYLVLYGEAQRAQLLTPSPPPTIPALPELDDAVLGVRQLLQQDDAAIPKERLAALLTKLESAQGRLSSMKVDASNQEGNQGRLRDTPQDSIAIVAISKSTQVENKVDSTMQTTEAQGRLSEQRVDFSDGVQYNQGKPLDEKSTPFATSEAQKGRLPAQEVDSAANKVDSDVPDQPSNVNVITVIDMIHVNVNLVAKFCCRALREPPDKLGVYQKLFRECEQDAKAIAAALIYTLVHRQDGTMRKPPAIFHKLCRKYHTEGIADEAVSLVEHYGSLTYVQLLDVLRGPGLGPVAPQRSAQEKSIHYHTLSSLPPLSSTMNLALLIPLKPGGGMTSADASHLRGVVAHDRRLGLCRTGVTPLADGTYAVLVDNTVSHKVRQAVFYSKQEWQNRSATLTSCMCLFTHDGETTAHPLRRLLQTRSSHE